MQKISLQLNHVTRKIRRLILLPLCLFFATFTVASFNAANANADANMDKTILFVNPGYEDKGFWQAVSQTMQAAATSLGFELKIVSANRSWAAMITKGISAIEDIHPDYLILVNENQKAADLLALANEKKIPTLLLLNTLTSEQVSQLRGPRENFKFWLGCLIPNNRQAGYEMLDALAKSLPSQAKILETVRNKSVPMLSLAGDIKTPASIQRMQGLDDGLSQHTNLKEIRRITVNWSQEEAYKRTKLFLKTHRDIKAIWAANDLIAFGAIQALKEAGLEAGKDVSVAGLNWSAESFKRVETGEMIMTHGGHFLAGAWSIVMLYDYEKGKDFADISHHLSFPMSAITQKNIASYQKALGNRDWHKINFKAFSRYHNKDLENYPFTLDHLLKSTK